MLLMEKYDIKLVEKNNNRQAKQEFHVNQEAEK